MYVKLVLLKIICILMVKFMKVFKKGCLIESKVRDFKESIVGLWERRRYIEDFYRFFF